MTSWRWNTSEPSPTQDSQGGLADLSRLESNRPGSAGSIALGRLVCLTRRSCKTSGGSCMPDARTSSPWPEACASAKSRVPTAAPSSLAARHRPQLTRVTQHPSATGSISAGCTATAADDDCSGRTAGTPCVPSRAVSSATSGYVGPAGATGWPASAARSGTGANTSYRSHAGCAFHALTVAPSCGGRRDSLHSASRLRGQRPSTKRAAGSRVRGARRWLNGQAASSSAPTAVTSDGGGPTGGRSRGGTRSSRARRAATSSGGRRGARRPAITAQGIRQPARSSWRRGNAPVRRKSA